METPITQAMEVLTLWRYIHHLIKKKKIQFCILLKFCICHIINTILWGFISQMGSITKIQSLEGFDFSLYQGSVT
jgi:hypothetical protein